MTQTDAPLPVRETPRTFAQQLKRFSLRSLLVITTICCVLLGIWSAKVKPFRDQYMALQAVNQLEGKPVVEAARGPAWQRQLVNKMLGPDAFTIVSEVDLSGADVNDQNVASLAGLHSMTRLNLDRTAIGDEGLATLAGLTNLQELSLRFAPITSAGIANLKALKNLEVLRLTSTKVSDDAIDSLAQLPRLENLFLRWTNVSEAGAAELRERMPDCNVHYLALPP